MYNPQLNLFIRVADSGSFAKAAEALYISTPAVVKQINALEKSVGLQLFARTHRGVTLTDAGKSFYEDAQYMIRYSRESISRAKRAQTMKYCVRIGVSVLTASDIFDYMIPRIHAKCPELQFQFVPFENKDLPNIYNNLGKKIDIVLGMCEVENEREYNDLTLSYEPICCALSVSHPLASKKVLTPQDMYEQNFYLFRRGYVRHLDLLRDYLENKHPQIHIMDMDHLYLQSFNMIESSRNLMFAIDKWRGKHPLVKIVPVDWEFRVPFGFFYPRKPSDAVRQFIDVASKEYRASDRRSRIIT